MEQTRRPIVGVLGASSLVGAGLLPLLVENGWQVAAFSRRRPTSNSPEGIRWLEPGTDIDANNILYWIFLAPIWMLPEYFDWMIRHGAQHIVALSSTSRFTKVDSSDPYERALAQRFADSEERLIVWAAEHQVAWTIFRPTLIYGLGLDKNVSQIASLIRRFGFFPLLGEAKGLRQPIHLEDLAAVCERAIHQDAARNQAFDVSGAEVLSYREMVKRIFLAMGKRPRFVSIPLWMFRIAVSVMRLLPAFRKWSPAMVERMNQDMIFDNAKARNTLGFLPRTFAPRPEDMS